MKKPSDCRLCYATARYNGYCGMHRRIVERDVIRTVNPDVSHHQAEQLIPRFNAAAEESILVADARALRYVIGRSKLSYCDAKADVLRFNKEYSK